MKHLYAKLILLPLLIAMLIAGCKKDAPDCVYCPPQGYVAPYDPDFVVFPTANVRWEMSESYSYTDFNEVDHMGQRTDSIYLGIPYTIITRTIPQNALALTDAATETGKLYFPLVRKYRGSYWDAGTQPVHYNGFDTLTSYRVDTANKILYEAFAKNNVWYEDPVFDNDVKAGDSVKYYRGNSFLKYFVFNRDSLLIGGRYWPRINQTLAGNLAFIKHSNVLNNLNPYAGRSLTIYYKNDTLTY